MGKTEKKSHDEPALSKNHNKSVKYRLRIQQEREAEQEIKESILEETVLENRTDVGRPN